MIQSHQSKNRIDYIKRVIKEGQFTKEQIKNWEPFCKIKTMKTVKTNHPDFKWEIFLLESLTNKCIEDYKETKDPKCFDVLKERLESEEKLVAEYPQLNFYYGLMHVELEEYNKAIEHFTYMIDSCENDVGLFLWLGYCYVIVGNPEKALESYKRAQSFEPEDFNTGLHIGTLLARLGKYNESMTELAEAISDMDGQEIPMPEYNVMLGAVKSVLAAIQLKLNNEERARGYAYSALAHVEKSGVREYRTLINAQKVLEHYGETVTPDFAAEAVDRGVFTKEKIADWSYFF